MAYEPKPNTGSLWKNEKTKDTQPDSTGSFLFCCPHCQRESDMRLSAWTKAHEVRGKWLSLKGEVKKPRDEAAREPVDMDDEIPF